MPFGHQVSKFPDDVGLSSQKELLSVQLNGLTQKIQEAEDQLKTYKDFTAQNEEVQGQVIETQKELDFLRTNLTMVKQVVADLNDKQLELNEYVEFANKTLAEKGNSIKDAEISLADIQKKQDELIAVSLSDSKDADEKLNLINKKIEEAQGKLDKILSDIATAQKTVSDENHKLEEIVVLTKAKQAELDDLSIQVSKADQYLTSVRMDILAVEAKKKSLEEEVVSIKQKFEDEKQQKDSEIKVREDAVTEREGMVSLKEKWLEDKAANLMQIKAEVEKFYGKPINIQF